MPYFLRAIALATATGACFLFFWVGAFLLSWVVLPLAMIALRGRTPIERMHRSQDIVGYGLRLFIASMRTVRNLVFRPWEVDLDLPDRPFVMIANHPTLIDVTALMALYPRICCVAKTEVYRSLLAGPLLRYCGHIEGGGLSFMEGGGVMQEGLDRLEKGQSVLIFPEGTRSTTDGLNNFKVGAFELATRAGVPIVPMLITCEPPTLMKGQSWYGLPKKTARYEITQLPVVQPGELAADTHSVAEHFQRLFQAELDARGRSRPERAEVSPACTPLGLSSGQK